MRWTKLPTQDFRRDNRGWFKGKRRKWNKEVEEKIRTIHEQLKNDPYQFYIGATSIEEELRKEYPEISLPPLRTIGRIMSDLKLSSKRKRDKHR
jgi:hypothetical protein